MQKPHKAARELQALKVSVPIRRKKENGSEDQNRGNGTREILVVHLIVE